MPPIRKKKTENSFLNVMRDLDSSGSRESNTFKIEKTNKKKVKSFYSEGAAFLSNNGGGDNNAQEESHDMGSIIKMYDNICQDKIKKFDNISASNVQTIKQMMSEVLNKQFESRKELTKKLAKNMGYMINQSKKDLSNMQESQIKLELLLAQSAKMAKDAQHAMCSRIEGMEKSLSNFEARVEGLLRSGGMRIEDRPLWWDVYRAFPPTREPTFSRPVPTSAVRQIFYQEDALRAKFHKSGQHLGSVNLSDDKRKSHAQRLIEIHNNLASENPNAGDELYDKCLDILQNELSSQRSDRLARNEQEREEGERSVSTMFSEAQTSRSREQTIKNIFKE